MNLLNGIVLCMLLGLATCDLGCFHEKLVACELEFFIKFGIEESSFCDTNQHMGKCMVDAANACNTGFEDEAEKANSLLNELCIDGSKNYEVLKKDNTCDIDTFANYQGTCSEDSSEEIEDTDNYFEALKTICRKNDRLKKCMYNAISQKCAKATQDIFRETYDASYNLQKKICEKL